MTNTTREIKFRAWDGNKVVDFGDLMCKQGHFNAFINTLAERTAANKPNDNKYKLMQYTGLKDKNGIEIYEGDIVKWRYGEKLFVSLVEWIDDEAMFKPNDMTKTPLVEVIGNIYQNKELLND